MTINFQEQLNSPLRDPQWITKLAYLSLSSFFFITSPAVAGYQMELIRETAAGQTEELPEIGPNFVSLWTKGLVLSLILAGLVLVPMSLVLGLFFSMTFMFTGHGALMVGWLLFAGLVSFLAATALTIPMPALVLNYVISGDVGSLLNLPQALRTMSRSPGDYAVIALLPVAAMVLSAMVSTTGVGAILTVPLFAFTWLVQGRMLGQYHRMFGVA
jgi:hypothetical protein